MREKFIERIKILNEFNFLFTISTFKNNFMTSKKKYKKKVLKRQHETHEVAVKFARICMQVAFLWWTLKLVVISLTSHIAVHRAHCNCYSSTRLHSIVSLLIYSPEITIISSLSDQDSPAILKWYWVTCRLLALVINFIQQKVLNDF